MFLAASGSPGPALDEWTHPDRAFLISEKEGGLKGSRCEATHCAYVCLFTTPT